jgi:hypothetical protein
MKSYMGTKILTQFIIFVKLDFHNGHIHQIAHNQGMSKSLTSFSWFPETTLAILETYNALTNSINKFGVDSKAIHS